MDVLRGSDMSVIGKVQIYGLSALAAGKSLDGYVLRRTLFVLLCCVNVLVCNGQVVP